MRKKEEVAAGNTHDTRKNPLLSSTPSGKDKAGYVTGVSMRLLGDGRHVGVFLFRRVLPFLALCCFAFFAAIPAGADGLPPPLPPGWNVSGALLLVGNPVCAGLPCTETIAFSFDVGYQLRPDLGNSYLLYLTNLQETGSGALGSFTLSFPGQEDFVSNADNHFVPLGDADFEIDIHMAENMVPAPVAPSLLDFADLYSCETATCITDFAPAGFQGSTPPIFGLHNPSGPVVSSVAMIPEPSTSDLLLFGLFALGLLGAAKASGISGEDSALGSR